MFLLLLTKLLICITSMSNCCAGKIDTLNGMQEFSAEIKRDPDRDELSADIFLFNVESPWENGIEERSFGVLFGTARALLPDALP